MDYQSFFESASRASSSLNLLDDQTIDMVLETLSKEIFSHKEILLEANKMDLERIPSDHPLLDRLKLDPDRINDISEGILQVSKLPSPLHRILEKRTMPNGMEIKKITFPFGVIGVIYEARPNVTTDVFSLCFKSGNACILKGGSEAEFSNRAIVGLIKGVLQKFGINPDIVGLLPVERKSTECLLRARGLVDLIIPRGGRSLIDFVRTHSKVPLIETGAGICHVYFDEYGALEKGKNIIYNAKTRRVSVCNALDGLLIHKKRLKSLFSLCQRLSDKNVMLYADKESFNALKEKYPPRLLEKSTVESYGTEFLDYKMSVKCVDSLEEALLHIRKYGSGHSESIVTENSSHADLFCRSVDAACVYVNLPTSFTDGRQFGLGAEIGISTQKLHARGPMGLNEMCTYKWIVSGAGQIRP